MIFLYSDVKFISEKDPFKKIELAGRTCYKSEAKITDGSAVKFFDALVKRGHTAMLEHATFCFIVTADVYHEAKECHYLHSTYNLKQNRYMVSGNLRAINESGNLELLKCLYKYKGSDGRLAYLLPSEFYQDLNCHAQLCSDIKALPELSEEEISQHFYATFRFITDRGVTHEMVRHRPFSFAQESTRYCNYSGGIAFIYPKGFDTEWSERMKQTFLNAMRKCEDAYTDMIRAGATPQQARVVLPNGVKTEIVVTGNDAEWQHFFDLRSLGATGAPHPDIKLVADKALDMYREVRPHSLTFA